MNALTCNRLVDGLKLIVQHCSYEVVTNIHAKASPHRRSVLALHARSEIHDSPLPWRYLLCLSGRQGPLTLVKVKALHIMKVLPHVGVSPIDDRSDGVITSKSAECCFSAESSALAPQGLGASTGGQIFDFRRDWPQN